MPTDRPLRPGSVVHYRYGSMRGLPESGLAGQDLYDLLDPAGRLTNDLRFGFYNAPHPDIADPFEAAGVRVEDRTEHTLYFRDPDGRRLGVSSYEFA